MLHCELTPAQTSQVEYLFRDNAFGTDPSQFRYEVDNAGRILGRVRIQQHPPRITRPREWTVNIQTPSTPGTMPERAIRALAAWVALSL